VPPIASTKPKQRQGNPSTLHRAPARLALQANRFPRPAVYIYTRRGQDGSVASAQARGLGPGEIGIAKELLTIAKEIGASPIASTKPKQRQGNPSTLHRAPARLALQANRFPRSALTGFYPLPFLLKLIEVVSLRCVAMSGQKVRPSETVLQEPFATVMNLSWLGIPLIVLKVVEFAPTAIVLVPRALRWTGAIMAAYEQAVHSYIPEVPEFRIFFICLATHGTNTRCFTMRTAKGWKRKYDTLECRSGQAYYCDCNAKYLHKWGCLVEFCVDGLFYYLKAPVPDAKTLDMLAMKAEAKFYKPGMSAAELFNVLPSIPPQSSTFVVPVGGDREVMKIVDPDFFDNELKVFAWSQILNMVPYVGKQCASR